MQKATTLKIAAFAQALVQEFGEGAVITRKQLQDFSFQKGFNKGAAYWEYIEGQDRLYRLKRGQYIVTTQTDEKVVNRMKLAATYDIPMTKVFEKGALRHPEKGTFLSKPERVKYS